jgi:hypothetical protein
MLHGIAATAVASLVLVADAPSTASVVCLRSNEAGKQVTDAQGVNRSTADAEQKALREELERRSTEERARPSRR